MKRAGRDLTEQRASGRMEWGERRGRKSVASRNHLKSYPVVYFVAAPNHKNVNKKNFVPVAENRELSLFRDFFIFQLGPGIHWRRGM